MKNSFLRNLLIYLLLVLGYIFIYVLDVESMVYPHQQNKVKSKVNFVYQQF